MLDTDICIYIAKNRYPQVTARFERMKPEQPVMSAITYGELQFGANKSSQSAPSTLSELDGTDSVYSRWKALRHLQRRRTEKFERRCKDRAELIGNNDLWIAAHAMALDVDPRDEQRTRVSASHPDLSVENWTK